MAGLQPDPVEPLYQPLSPDEISALDAGLALASRLTAPHPPTVISALQALYDILLTEPDFAAGHIALGIAFGEYLRARGPFAWLRLVDEFGRETSLGVIGLDLCCSPISMIQKRLAKHEHWDLAELAVDTIEAMASGAEACRAARAE